jgi:hypothetical protein
MMRSIKIIFFFTPFIILSSFTLDSSSYEGCSLGEFTQKTDDILSLSLSSSDAIPVSELDQVINWNTFMGSADEDSGRAIASDGSGNVYVTGYSDTTWGTPINPHTGNGDAFVAKLNNMGELQWNTFMGSEYGAIGYAISVDGSGNIYVTGVSGGTWGTPVNPFGGGWSDAFAAKFNSNGELQWNTFLGSDYEESATGIAVDESENVYISGLGWKTWGTPVNPFAGMADVFVVKLNSSGELQWNTFMGSDSDDSSQDISVDGIGNVCISGTSSKTWGTPVNSYAGARDVFVAKLNSDGALQWNTFMGSTNEDFDSGIVADGIGNTFIAGYCESTWGIPIIPHTGTQDGFIAKLNSDGVLQWNTFLGSATWDDEALGIEMDEEGNVYVTGNSLESWGTPVNPHSGYVDAFIAKLNSSGIMQWNAFMGSVGDDRGLALEVGGDGSIFVTGYSWMTWGTPVNPHVGDQDAFVAKILGGAEINVRIAGIGFADGSTRNLGTRPSSFIMGREFPFTIENLGLSSLSLTGSPMVTLSGPHASHFQITQQPSSPVGAFGKTTFKLRTVRDSLPGFLPIGWEYSVSFTVNIPNDDDDENPYDFTLNFTLKKD